MLAGEENEPPKPWWILAPRHAIPPRGSVLTQDGWVHPPPLVLESGELDVVYPLPRDSESYIPNADSLPSVAALFDDDAREHHRTMNSGKPWLSDQCQTCGRRVIARVRKLGKKQKDEMDELDLKIEVAARYLLCNDMPEKLAGIRRCVNVGVPSIRKWLKQTTKLLRLNMKPAYRHP
jgi:hypothetical protein